MSPGKSAVASLLTMKMERPVLDILMLDENLPYFLMGSWAGGGMLLKVDESLNLESNLAIREEDYVGYLIVDRVLMHHRAEDFDDRISVGKFTITGKDSLEFQLFMDGKTYKLKRQG